MNSPGHRANILNANFTYMGLGYTWLVNDGGRVNYQHYWTQAFGAGDPNPGQYVPQGDPTPSPEPPTQIPTIKGTQGKDELTGNSGNNTLFGYAGDDTLRGREGDDELLAASGNDLLDGGDGNDRLEGGKGNDTLTGESAMMPSWVAMATIDSSAVREAISLRVTVGQIPSPTPPWAILC